MRQRIRICAIKRYRTASGSKRVDRKEQVQFEVKQISLAPGFSQVVTQVIDP